MGFSSTIEDDLADRINDERERRGYSRCTVSTVEPLASWARNWARHMSNNGFAHSNMSPLINDGTWNVVGEIIATGSKGVLSSAIHLAWMHSSEHRNIILDRGFTRISVGAWCDGAHNMWAVVNFARLTSQGAKPANSGGNTALTPLARVDKSTLSC